MKTRVLLGVTGSVAAIKTPQLVAGLCEAGFESQVFATEKALHFFDPLGLAPSRPHGLDTIHCMTESDEWKGGGLDGKYHQGDKVLHIELRKWADILVIAPLDANYLARFALGLTDGCLASLWRAWNWDKPVVLAPAMNTSMWRHPATRRHITAIAEDTGMFQGLLGADPDGLIQEINKAGKNLYIVPPVSKLLACGDEGMGGMGDTDSISKAVAKFLSRG